MNCSFFGTFASSLAYLQFYFIVYVSCKVAFEERTCTTIVNTSMSFSLNLKLNVNKWHRWWDRVL